MPETAQLARPAPGAATGLQSKGDRRLTAVPKRRKLKAKAKRTAPTSVKQEKGKKAKPARAAQVVEEVVAAAETRATEQLNTPRRRRRNWTPKRIANASREAARQLLQRGFMPTTVARKVIQGANRRIDTRSEESYAMSEEPRIEGMEIGAEAPVVLQELVVARLADVFKFAELFRVRGGQVQMTKQDLELAIAAAYGPRAPVLQKQYGVAGFHVPVDNSLCKMALGSWNRTPGTKKRAGPADEA